MPTGRDEINKNVQKRIEKIIKAVRKGLLNAGIDIRNAGQKITPVDTSNLINSWYGPNVVGYEGNTVMVEIGLTAEYAPYVHEMIETKFKKPDAEAKFLEKPMKESEYEILNVVWKEVKKVM